MIAIAVDLLVESRRMIAGCRSLEWLVPLFAPLGADVAVASGAGAGFTATAGAGGGLAAGAAVTDVAGETVAGEADATGVAVGGDAVGVAGTAVTVAPAEEATLITSAGAPAVVAATRPDPAIRASAN